MSRKPPVGKSLGDLNKTLLEQWHPTKNGNLTAYDFFEGSGKKVWWKCEKGEDHEWEAKIQHRSNGKRSGCPFCGNRKLSVTNSLRTVSKEISEEWHLSKNAPLTPDSVIGAGEKKYWWKCRQGEDHEWQASISNRLKGTGCPVCRGLKVVKSNSLASTHPHLNSEWHPTKNENLTPHDVSQGSRKSVWWKCSEGDDHVWKSSVFNRTIGTGCPICQGFIVTSRNNLQVQYPKLASQWHPTLNYKLKPIDVFAGGHKKYWWNCPGGDDHQWQTSISKRVSGNNCPICSNKLIMNSNSLATLNPQLASEWHPTKNKTSPNDYGVGSHAKVWWKCSKGDDHIWAANIVDRNSGNGCPFCTLTPQSREELTITFELKQFFTINPKGFKTQVNGKLWSIDIFVEELNLGIEFDGSYWHKDKRALDKLKPEKLQEDGFQIMRIREEHLKPITPIDVISKIPFNAKKVTNDILDHILNTYPIVSELKKDIKSYFKKRKIQNEDALNEYIEQILFEKAQRKNKK